MINSDSTDDFPCSEERCSYYLTDNPSICVHYDNNAEAISYWGDVLIGKCTIDDVIPEYKEYLDFEKAVENKKIDFFDNKYNWLGPTVTIELRHNSEIIKEFTAYPFNGIEMRDFDNTLTYIDGYIEAFKDFQNYD